MRIETAHPKEFGAAEAARWRAHQRAEPALRSPYLAPEWAQIVGAARQSARVCVIDGGRGFLGVQKLSRFAAMGLGAPIADYQGMVGEAGLAPSPAALCRALGVGRIDLSHTPAGQPVLAGAARHTADSWIADVSGGRDLYEAGLRKRRGEFVRQTEKKLRRLNRERGGAQFAVSTDRGDFETLLGWKRAQLRDSRQPPIWDTPWVRQVIETCFETRGETFGGVLFTLRVGDRLAAANFCLRGECVLHMWIIGHDAAFEADSPGVQLARWACGWAGEHGLAEVDFGPGDYRYKRQLATAARALEWGAVAGASLSGMVRHAEFALRTRIERLPHPRLAALPGKAMRRMDLARALAA